MANDISVRIGAETAGLERGFAKLVGLAENSAGKMSVAFRGVNSVLGTLAATASVGALANLVNSVSETGDQLAKLSTKTDAAVEDLSKLQYAASLADLSNESLAASLIKLNKVMGEAKDGSTEATAALQRFGIDPNSGIGVVEAFSQIAESVKNTGDATRVASGLNDVFGKSFGDLIPLLKGGRDGLKDAGDELERMGGVMSTELAQSSEAFNDNLTRITRQMEALKVSVIGPLLPTMNEIAKAFVSSSDGADKLSGSGSALKTILETVAVLGANVAYVFTAVGSEIGGIAAQMAALSTGDFKAFSRISEVMREDAEKARKEVDALTDRLLNPQSAAPAAGASSPSAAGIADAAGKPGKKTKAEKPVQEYNALAVAADAYNKAIDKIAGAQLAAIDSTRGLDAAQATLLDLQRSDEWELMPEVWQKVAIKQAGAASEALKLADAEKQVNALLSSTPTAKLEDARRLMVALTGAFEAGKITADEYTEAARTANGAEDLEIYNARVEAESARHVERMKELDDQLNSNRYTSQMIMISGAQDLSDNLMQILKESGEEGSALGKTLFAMQKAMQVATIIMQGEAASASIISGMAQAGAIAASMAGPGGPAVLAGYMADGAAMAMLTKGMAYANAGLVAGAAIASAEGGFDIPAGVNPLTQLHEEEMVLPKRQANVIRDLARNGGGGMKLTIVNNTRGTIGQVTEQRIGDDERALIIEEAVNVVSAQLGDPNSRPSRAMNRSYNVQRSR